MSFVTGGDFDEVNFGIVNDLHKIGSVTGDVEFLSRSTGIVDIDIADVLQMNKRMSGEIGQILMMGKFAATDLSCTESFFHDKILCFML
jgi:hypothetical protein